MGGDAGAEASDGVGSDGFAYQLAVAEAVEHSGVGAEVAAPAHTHSCEDGNGVVVDDARFDECGHEADGCSHGAEGRDGERHQCAVLEAEEPVEDEVDLVGQPGDDRHAFVGGTGIFAVGARGAEGEHHNYGRDAEHAGNDGHADAHAALAAVEHCVQETLEYRTFALERYHLLGALFLGHRGVKLRIAFQGEALHQSGADDAAYEGAHQTYHSSASEAFAGHKGNDNQAHTEGGAEVGQRHQLVFLEVACKVVVLGQRDDGGVVAEEGHHGSQCSHTGQVEEGFHQRPQYVLHQAHNAKFGQQFRDGAHQHADGHNVEHRLEQQVVGRLHKGVEHIGQRHPVCQEAEEAKEADEEYQSLEAASRGEFEAVGLALALLFLVFCLVVAKHLKGVQYRQQAVVFVVLWAVVACVFHKT